MTARANTRWRRAAGLIGVILALAGLGILAGSGLAFAVTACGVGGDMAAWPASAVSVLLAINVALLLYVNRFEGNDGSTGTN